MGETKALSTFVPHVRKKYPQAFIYVTTTTETGQKEAQKRIPEANAFGYLPLDFSWVVKKMVRHLRPSLFILVEGDYWLNLIRAVKKQGGKVNVVSGTLSEKSLQRYRLFPFFSRLIFGSIDHFCLQEEREKNRFLKLQVSPKRITVTGNLKYDVPIEPSPSIETLKRHLRLTPKDRVLTLGSIHKGEDALLYTLLSPLLQSDPDLKIVIVPRYPNRFFQTRSWATHPNVHFIDQMGILPTCYHVSDLAIVGGSFIPGIGGHDIFEPVKMGIPTLYGPHMDQQGSLERMIRKSGAARQVKPLELASVVSSILNDLDLHVDMGKKGKHFADQMKGVALRTWKEVEKRIFLEYKLKP